MFGLCRKFALVMVFVFVASVMFLVEPSVAPVTTPATPSSAPEVSVEIQHNPLVIPPTYSTNPYTGETQQIFPGSIQPQGNITITIKNRSFNTYIDKDGNTINVYYVFFIKPESQSWNKPQYAEYQSNSDYTTITFPYSLYGAKSPYHIQVHNGMVWSFRVQAVIGYFTPGYEVRPGFPDVGWYYVDPVYEGEGSAFTEFTITISNSDKPDISKPNIPSPPNPTSTSSTPITSNNNTPSISDNYNASQQKPSQSTLIIILVSVCIISILLSVIAYQHKQRKTKPTLSQSNDI